MDNKIFTNPPIVTVQMTFEEFMEREAMKNKNEEAAKTQRNRAAFQLQYHHCVAHQEQRMDQAGNLPGGKKDCRRC